MRLNGLWKKPAFMVECSVCETINSLHNSTIRQFEIMFEKEQQQSHNGICSEPRGNGLATLQHTCGENSVLFSTGTSIIQRAN